MNHCFRVRRARQSPSANRSPVADRINNSYAAATETQTFKEIQTCLRQASKSISSVDDLTSSLLRPDGASIQEALKFLPKAKVTDVLSDYFDKTEHTFRVCLNLHACIERLRSVCSPIRDVLDGIDSNDQNSPSRDQCEWAFDRFVHFHDSENPFEIPDSTSLLSISCWFDDINKRLISSQGKAEKRIRLYRNATRGSTMFLIGSTIGIVAVGVVVATHAIAAIVAGPPLLLAVLHHPTNPLSSIREELREKIKKMAAVKIGAFWISNALATIDRLVTSLQGRMESTKNLVRIAIDRGRGERHATVVVLTGLRKTQTIFTELQSLDDHICMLLDYTIHSRSQLLQLMRRTSPPPPER